MADLVVTMARAAGAGPGAAPGQLTRAQLITLGKQFLGRTGTEDDATMVTLLNFSQQEIARVRFWNCLRVVTTGSTSVLTNTYSWPGVVRAVHSFNLTGDDEAKLWPMTTQHVNQVYPDLSELTKSVPANYVDRGSYYQFVPPADAVYPWSLEYSKWPSDLAADGDTSDLVLMDDLLVYMLCMHMSAKLGLREDYSFFRTAIYTEYPVGSTNKRGLLAQAILADSRRAEGWVVKRPFLVGEEAEQQPPNYLTNPRYGLR